MILVMSLVLGTILIAAAKMTAPPAVQRQAQGPVQQEKKDFEAVFMDDYEKAVAVADKKVLVIFGADWCGYCRLLKNDLKDMDLKNYVVCVVDLDRREDIGRKLDVRSLPTSVIMLDGKQTSRKEGYKKNEYQDWLSANRTKE